MKKLGFGTMRLPLTDPDDEKSIDYEQMCHMVDHFLEQGFTYFDTAYPYHGEQSEGAVKRCLVDRHPRERYILEDKMPIFRVKAKDFQPLSKDEQEMLQRVKDIVNSNTSSVEAVVKISHSNTLLKRL